MKSRKYIKKISDVSIAGGLAAVVLATFSGCEQRSGGGDAAFSEASQKQGAFVVVQEVAPNEYKIVDEYPSSTTRVILKDMNGNERILSQEELDKLIAEEAKKIDEGTSNLTNPGGMGMGLGETILASAAGAILGSYIGNKLFNNQNYQSQRRTSYKSPSTYSKSVDSFNKKTASSTKSTSSKSSGFFGSKSGSSSKSSFGFGG
jgi:hypothetical protein